MNHLKHTVVALSETGETIKEIETYEFLSVAKKAVADLDEALVLGNELLLLSGTMRKIDGQIVGGYEIVSEEE